MKNRLDNVPKGVDFEFLQCLSEVGKISIKLTTKNLP